MERTMLKANAEEALARLEDLFSGRGRDRIFVHMQVKSPALALYAGTHVDGERGYPDLREREAFWRGLAAESRELRDDSIPTAYMSEFDEGLYTGLMGAEIRYLENRETGWVSSMSVPFLERLDDIERLEFDRTGALAELYSAQLRFYAEESRGNYGISHFILIDGLNALLELRGATNMYYDCVDEPGKVRRFFDFARTVNYWVQDRFFEIIGPFRGGTCSNLGQWIPGRIVSESLDPFHMASVDFFEQWGRENAERVFGRYDGGIIHIHTGNGMHLVRPASTLKGLKMIAFIDEDFNPMKAFHQLPQIDADRGDVPVHLSVPMARFAGMLAERRLVGNALYSVTEVPDVSTANSLMEKVRMYSPPSVAH
jgi:hypothetical protein